MFTIFEERLNNNINFTKISLDQQLELIFCNQGAAIYKILFSDKFNNFENILVTPAARQDWLQNRTFSGATIGPLAGRYETTDTKLEANRSPFHFHGGTKGWDTILWEQEIEQTDAAVSIIYRYITKEYSATIQYTVTSKATLTIDSIVIPKTNCLINPTNHMYFNLNGDPFQPITNHLFQLSADAYYVENSAGLIQAEPPAMLTPTINFSTLTPLNRLPELGGINTTFKLSQKQAGTLYQPENGRQIDFQTTLPAAVIYTFNASQPIFAEKDRAYPPFAAITFEAQYPANSLELVTFSPERPYYAQTSYTFSVV